MSRRMILACAVVGASLLGASCAADSPSSTDANGGSVGTSATGTSVASTPGTDAPPASSPVSSVAESRPTATVASDLAVEASFRQGIAKAEAGWIMSNDLTLFQTDEDFAVQAKNEAAIPADLLAQEFDHLGDIDVEGGVIYAPLEQGDYDAMRQAMVRYDATTLAFIDLVEVAQSHNAWVSVDPDTMIAYSMSGFTDDAVLRYDVAGGWTPMEPIPLDRTVARVQGGDVARGYLWLSTDDESNGLYRVDLASGAVVDLGSAPPIDGEGEGIDATDLPTGDLHVLVADPAAVPMWVDHLVVG